MAGNAPASLPARRSYGEGCYRRCIVLEGEAGEVRGELADDFHHFAVRVRCEGDAVAEVAGRDVRVPWTTCPGALEPLRRMEGAPLSFRLLDLLRHTPAREQCTHLHDLACLAIAHAARLARGGAAARCYDAALPDRVDGVTRCTLARDGQELLAWRIEGTRITRAEGAAWEGLEITGRKFHERLRAEADADLAEAAWVLRRAVFIGLGRQYEFDEMHTAEAFASLVGGSCHTFQPERVAQGKRVRGSVRDFTHRAGHLIARPEPPG